ncbi:hypothetical protein, partial [Pseudomonas gingeri]
GLIAGKPAPTGFLAGRYFAARHLIVGAGLLAMASGQSMRDSLASSLASQLLQVFWQGDILPADT